MVSLYRALHQARSLDDAMLHEAVRSTVPLSITRAEDLQELREMAKGRFTPVA